MRADLRLVPPLSERGNEVPSGQIPVGLPRAESGREPRRVHERPCHGASLTSDTSGPAPSGSSRPLESDVLDQLCRQFEEAAARLERKARWLREELGT